MRLFLLFLVACASTPSAKLDEPFTLRAGTTTRIEGTSLRVTFVEVVNDSRCPPDVQCIWEGDATVRIRVSDQTRSEEIELHTHRSRATSRSAFGYTIALRSLSAKPDYAAELKAAAAPPHS